MTQNVAGTPSKVSYRVISNDDTVTRTKLFEEDNHSSETDEEIIQRITERFEVLTMMTRSIKAGTIRSMIVAGAPGVGKSYGIEQELGKHDIFNKLAGVETYEIIKGDITAVNLYKKLYEYKNEKNIIVFDDCDGVLLDEESLNLLKGALDSGKKRRISWLSESRVLADAGIPNTFDFNGGIIFVTNQNVERTRSHKIRAHLEALVSRCHYLDLTIHSSRDVLLRIKQLVDIGWLDAYDISAEDQADILEWITEKHSVLRDFSLRSVIKAAELVTTFGKSWRNYANSTLIRNR